MASQNKKSKAEKAVSASQKGRGNSKKTTSKSTKQPEAQKGFQIPPRVISGTIFLALFILLDTWNDFSDYFLLLIGALMIAIGLVTIKNRRILSIIYLTSGIIVIIGFFLALFINPSFIIG